MKHISFTIFILLACAAVNFAQEITDEDRRGFDDSTPIRIDGDGRADAFTPRIYQISTKKGKPPNERDIQNRLAFDLTASSGRIIKSFFKYNYGTAEAGGSYWVYALKAAGDVNGDGKIDLVFYSGDDTSDETIWLANKNGRFVEFRRVTSAGDDW
jgi:hypothetical protein